MLLHVLLLCAFAVATTEFVLVGLLPDVAAGLAVSLPTVGLLVTAYMLVATIGGPVATVLTQRAKRRRVLACTMALALASAVVSARADSYGLLLGARLGSALAQALFVAVASQVAMAVVPAARQTAAVARIFNGFALATLIGLPLGTLVGQRYGWHAAFMLVAVLSAAGLVGVLVFCPDVQQPTDGRLGHGLAVLLRPPVVFGLAVTGLALTGFVAAFTYVAPMLRDLAGLEDVGVSVALVVYGLGTIAGSVLASRVHPRRILDILPAPLAALAAVLLAQGALMHQAVTAVLSLLLMGASAFVVVPLVQTWLMGEVGPSAAGVAAAVNVSVAGLAAALGAGLGGAVIGTGLGLAWVSPVAGLLPLAAMGTALALRRVARFPRPMEALGNVHSGPPSTPTRSEEAFSCC